MTSTRKILHGRHLDNRKHSAFVPIVQVLSGWTQTLALNMHHSRGRPFNMEQPHAEVVQAAAVENNVPKTGPEVCESLPSKL